LYHESIEEVGEVIEWECSSFALFAYGYEPVYLSCLMVSSSVSRGPVDSVGNHDGA
jgi:hypothetical protein